MIRWWFLLTSFTPDKLTRFAAIAVAVAVAVLLLGRWSTIYWRGRIERWARNEGLKLVSGARLFQDPSRFMGGRNQAAFRVLVEDRNGIRRTVWLQFGTRWGFMSGMPLTKIEWTDDNEI